MASGKASAGEIPAFGISSPSSPFQASGDPESPSSSSDTDASESDSSFSSTPPQAATSSTSQATISPSLFSRPPRAPGASQTAGISGLSNDFSRNPQVVSTSRATGAPGATGTSQNEISNTFSSLQAGCERSRLPGLSGGRPYDAPEVTSTPLPTGTSGVPSVCKAPAASRKTPAMAKQSPPIPFDRFASSEIFTIRVGTNLQAFHIHKDLLAGLSDEMRNHVYNNTKEGQVISMEMEDVSPDTMRRFMEFCYSGDYLYASGSGSNSDNPLKDKDATEALPLLLTHAKLYVFADMFNIVSLKELSGRKLIALTGFFGKLEDRVYALAMISLMDYVLHNIPVTTETPDKLVKFLARYAGDFIEKLGGYPEFHAVLASSTREDFFRVFCSHV